MTTLKQRTFATALACMASLGTALPAHAQTQTQTSAPRCATVEVHNVRPQQGFLMVAAFTDADSYNKKPSARMQVPAGDAITTFQLCGLSGEVVALTLFQDLDSDGKMGQNLLGMPTEPWGASGSPGLFGPQWESTKVALTSATIIVKMSL